MINGKGDIPLAVVGCDFRVASSRWRSMLVLGDEEAGRMALDLARCQAADGFLELCTCNRNEWVVSSRDSRWAAELLRAQMKARVGEEGRDRMEPYVLVGREAARHIFRVALGQESLVVGERQIAGQLFRALETARARGTSSRLLNGLGSIAGRLVRIALRRGCIGNVSCGVHSLAVSYLRSRLGDGKTKVAVVGLGSIGRRVRGILEEQTSYGVISCNRTVGEDGVRPLEELGAVLAEAEGAVICTGAMEPVLRGCHIPQARGERPLIILDLGIPEQVERLGLPLGVEVAGLDELTAFRGGHCAEGPRDEEEAEGLVRRAVEELVAFGNEEPFSVILDTIQRNHRQLVSEEIPRLLRGQLHYLPEADRVRLEGDIRTIILDYTNEVFRTIKETSTRETEH